MSRIGWIVYGLIFGILVLLSGWWLYVMLQILFAFFRFREGGDY